MHFHSQNMMLHSAKNQINHSIKIKGTFIKDCFFLLLFSLTSLTDFNAFNTNIHVIKYVPTFGTVNLFCNQMLAIQYILTYGHAFYFAFTNFNSHYHYFCLFKVWLVKKCDQNNFYYTQMNSVKKVLVNWIYC